MPRPKSADPTARVCITLPQSLLRAAGKASTFRHMSLSAWIAALVRKALNG